MRAVFYRAPDGSEPVRDFIDNSVPVRGQVLLDNQIDLLNRLTTTDPLAFPHSSQVRGELRELRWHCGRDLYRVLYRRSRNLFVLLHAFRKSSRTVPAEDIAIAEARWEDFRRRMEAHPRTPPRAGGHNAPARP